MYKDLRLELSFKNILQLEKKINFCLTNRINKINIPCKGFIKKKLLDETIEYIGENYSELDVIYHYSLYHQYNTNRENSYIDFLNFIKKCISYKNNEILLVSGSNKRKNFEVLEVMSNFKNEKNLDICLGIAYNPYLKKYFNNSEEKIRFEKKISLGLTKSIWLQFGTDIKLLKSEINYLKTILNNTTSRNNKNVKIFGSLLIPSSQFISRFKFRPWKGVYISDKYLNSLSSFQGFTKELINIYFENNIYPLIETECSSKNKLENIYSLFNI
tara:strand:- start:1310 stop:2125 length:816 start_codon:yes stop_codon:yes gene_type:complete